jgi:hypothetical protein
MIKKDDHCQWILRRKYGYQGYLIHRKWIEMAGSSKDYHNNNNVYTLLHEDIDTSRKIERKRWICNQKTFQRIIDWT